MTLSGLAETPPRATASRSAAKSAQAFRTISEVADDLHIPQHVLRFWETRFPQIKPLKRAGGRRYYRPDDIILLRRIRQCLYEEGYTIKGVQKLLREGGAPPEALHPAPPPAVVATPSQRNVGTDERQSLLELRRELVELRDLLRRMQGG